MQKVQTVPATTGNGKPTKYHYYPHNQHIYLLPECAIQQVCNAVYVRLNYTQPLCACPSRYRDPCSASLNEDDLHTTKLTGDSSRKVKIIYIFLNNIKRVPIFFFFTYTSTTRKIKLSFKIKLKNKKKNFLLSNYINHCTLFIKPY